MLLPQQSLTKPKLILFLFLSFCTGLLYSQSQSCNTQCDALASYYISQGSTLFNISQLFSTSIQNILPYNNITNPDVINSDTRLLIPFTCSCLQPPQFLAHQFQYSSDSGDFYARIAQTNYSNLTTVDMMQRFNSYPVTNIPLNAILNVTVNCSCGDSGVSRDYGLFITYPLRPGESLSSISRAFEMPERLLQDYNTGVDFGGGSGLVFIPGRDQNGTYPPLRSTASSSNGISGGAIAGIAVAGVAAALFLAACFYFGFYRRKKVLEGSLLKDSFDDHGSEITLVKTSESSPLAGRASPIMTGITVDKSVDFSYEELARATDDFSLAKKIGQGGFGVVYFAELRGEKAAIKKMDLKASKEFLAELNVLTHVHHLNLVRLIGYCVENSLFLVYEFIENGNLSQHLRDSGMDPLPWSTRVQIALDSARALEYIHEHTVPAYIHRDIKSPNILIDQHFRAKVADFGLTKLTEAGGASLNTGVVGTFGYLSPEYAQYGDVSPKTDVYAFGVVLYELISAKEAIVKTQVGTELKGLVALFEDELCQPDPEENIRKLVDPRLGDNYPLDSVYKIAQLAKACTQERPQVRPTMRSIVVALMTLSSSTEDWNIDAYENQTMANLISGR